MTIRFASCALMLSLLATGCATQSAAPAGAQVEAARLAQTIVAGRTTKAELLAAFGPTNSIRFDSGYEAWVYQSPAGRGRFAEFVVLIDPNGVVSKTRTRAASEAPR
jgi:hypothetical protein